MKVGGIYIQSLGVTTPAGSTELFFEALSQDRHFFTKRRYLWGEEWVSPLAQDQEVRLAALREERSLFQALDRTTLMGIMAARQALSQSGWQNDHIPVGVIVGSSRGATETFESMHKSYLEHPEHRAETLASPTTTLGNLASTIAQDLLLGGPELSFSITCSTALHSLVSALSWIQSGMCPRMLVGGSEAALTEFTLAQMKALRIYCSSDDAQYPCKPLASHQEKKMSFALGEAAVVVSLEGKKTVGSAPTLAEIAGVGWSVEPTTTLTSASVPGDAFYSAMARACEGLAFEERVDAIIAHAPGTIVGDASELAAVSRLFPSDRPILYSPKWQFGHSFGASGALNLAAAIHLLLGGTLYRPPFQIDADREHSNVQTVLVNSAGFGGNACSVLLRRGSHG